MIRQTFLQQKNMTKTMLSFRHCCHQSKLRNIPTGVTTSNGCGGLMISTRMSGDFPFPVSPLIVRYKNTITNNKNSYCYRSFSVFVSSSFSPNLLHGSLQSTSNNSNNHNHQTKNNSWMMLHNPRYYWTDSGDNKNHDNNSDSDSGSDEDSDSESDDDNNESRMTMKDGEVVNETLLDIESILEKQSDDSLTKNEIELKNALQELALIRQERLKYTQEKQQTQEPQTQQEQEEDPDSIPSTNLPVALQLLRKAYQESLHRVRDGFEVLQYWEHALRTEQELEAAYLVNIDTSEHVSLVDSWYRQGKFHHRILQYRTAMDLYERSKELYEVLYYNKQSKEDVGNDDDGLIPIYRHEILPHPKTNMGYCTNIASYGVELTHIYISIAGIHHAKGKHEDSLATLLHVHQLVYANNPFVLDVNHKAVITNKTNSNNNDDKIEEKETEVEDWIVRDIRHQYQLGYLKCLKYLGLLYRTMERYEEAREQYQMAWDYLNQIQQNYYQTIKTKSIPPTKTKTKKINDEDVIDMDMDNADIDQYNGDADGHFHYQRQGLLLDLGDMNSVLQKLDDSIKNNILVWQEDQMYRYKQQQQKEVEQQKSQVDVSEEEKEAAMASQFLPIPVRFVALDSISATGEILDWVLEYMDDCTVLDSLILHNLGKLYAAQGQYDIARRLLEPAVTIRRTLIGSTSMEVGKTLERLGAVYAALHHYEDDINDNNDDADNNKEDNNNKKDDDDNKNNKTHGVVVVDDNTNDDTDDSPGGNSNTYKSIQCFQQALLIAKVNSTYETPDKDPYVMSLLYYINKVKEEAKKD